MKTIFSIIGAILTGAMMIATFVMLFILLVEINGA
jgi:hypothetical protein